MVIEYPLRTFGIFNVRAGNVQLVMEAKEQCKCITRKRDETFQLDNVDDSSNRDILVGSPVLVRYLRIQLRPRIDEQCRDARY